MKKDQAIKLLDETFENDFELDRFAKFLRELFNKFSIKNGTGRDCTQYIAKEYTDFIENFKQLGDYSDNKGKYIEVLSVKLKKTSTRDRARTMQRNFIANWLSKTGKDAALVAFYGDESPDWRFSFVKMDYKRIEVEPGKIRNVQELTPAKRYSFLVGVNEPNHTCRRQFLELVSREDEILIDEIENSFSIENVTKEFFQQYKELFLELQECLEKILKKDKNVKEEFENKDISIVDFSKKLLGQIVFLYFLQKKGWLGVTKGENGGFNDWGTGPKNFVRRLYDKKIIGYDNFFNDVLEPLFYEALAKERDGDYYSRFKCKIPFLNGGLFEPINNYTWETTDILLENKIFEKILDTFDRFNFTIKEDEPLEKEVAVDPEMLGKVFENLLEVKDRKSKGAFYTPREIVHYMCQQSLINYLQTNTDLPDEDIKKFIQMGDFALDQTIRARIDGRASEKLMVPSSVAKNFKKIDNLLKEIKIVDPAVGSGAFPVGMMNEIIKARSVLTVYFDKDEQTTRTDYSLKRDCIENCLYGVDIESSAVEITKLRFWLSLIVDELDINNIQPLPNLDNKIMCGNSLVEEFEGVKLFDERLLNGHHEQTSKQTKLDEHLEKKRKESKVKLTKLRELQKDFFNEQNRQKKNKLREDIERIEWEFIEEKLNEEGNEEALQRLEKYKSNKSKPFFLWKLYFSDVFHRENPGFDVVIANPPYVGVKGHSDIFEPIRKGKFGKYYSGRGELFYFFFHLALDIGRDNSFIAFITTNYYPTATYGNLLRKDLKERSQIISLINFNELRIFETALGQHNMITLLKKSNNGKAISQNSDTKRKGIANSSILLNILNGGDTETEYYSVSQENLYEGEDDYIRLGGTSKEGNKINTILHKISENPLLKDICYVRQGLRTGIDKISKSHIQNYNFGGNIGEGVFVLSKKELKNLGVDINEKPIVKDFFKNSDISQFYSSNKATQYVLYLDKRFNEKIIKNDFPKIYLHLSKYKELITKIRGRNNEKLGKWINLDRPRENFIFTSEKIIAPQRSYKNTFGYNKGDWYASADVYYIIKKKKDYSLKYILGIVNSKLYYLWLYLKGKRKGNMLELYQRPLSEIPIKKASKEQQKSIIDIADKILAITYDEDYQENQEKQAKVKAYQRQIDRLVYELYGLTPEEIDIVEGFEK